MGALLEETTIGCGDDDEELTKPESTEDTRRTMRTMKPCEEDNEDGDNGDNEDNKEDALTSNNGYLQEGETKAKKYQMPTTLLNS